MRRYVSLIAALFSFLVATPSFALQTTFHVTFDEAVQPAPYTGRVYVALAAGEDREPRLGMNAWFDPPPLFAVDVEGVAAGEVVVVDGGALFHPTPLGELEAGTWRAQAVARRSLDGPRPGTGPGDLHGEVVTLTVGESGAGPVELRLTQVVAERAFEESDRVKLFELESRLLSEFHGRPFTLRAGVVLPDGWAEEGDRRYPIVYRVPGFGGTHFGAPRFARRIESAADDHPSRHCLHVVLDPSCYRGHSVFADSENNGPWGAALVRELIPALEERFRGPLDPRFRFVTGGSSGGWSSLWLQVTYPEDFGACFSHVPDPVDFRDFQRIDLYREGESVYVDGEGERRPLARRRDRVLLWYEDFVARETVLGPGGQIHSFEACFSPRGPDGAPLPVFDRETGVVDTAVAKAWEAYDIRLVLERDWDELAPRLEGKLHVYAGEVDTFYLEGAVGLLEEFFDGVDADVVCETIPGMGHSSHPAGVEAMYGELFERWEAEAARGVGD